MFQQRVSAISFINVLTAIEFFTFNTKLPEIAILASKDITVAKKFSPVRLDLMITGPIVYPTESAWHVLVSLKLLVMLYSF